MCMTQQTEKKSVKRDYKSRMFTMIFRDKRELLGACKTLGDYAEYVYRVREHAKEMSIEEAVDKAIDECIREDILREFLENNRAEARAMSIYEYDQEENIRLEREDAFEDGCKAHLISQVQKKLAKQKSVEVIAEELEENVETITALIQEIK